MNQEEIWKDIPGYEGYYQVSNLGKVRSLDRSVNTWNGKRGIKGIILLPAKNLKGYLFVQLHKDGKKEIKTIHRLVAIAFLPNPNNHPQINHKDEDKTNNHVNNLEWCDGLYNARYGTRNLRVSRKKGRALVAIDSNGLEVGRYASLMEASTLLGRSKSAICGYIKRGGLSPIGLTFNYI